LQISLFMDFPRMYVEREWLHRGSYHRHRESSIKKNIFRNET
jgi:hypothetical protein